MKKIPLIALLGLHMILAQAFTLPRQPTKSYTCESCDQLSREDIHDKWDVSNQTLNKPLSNQQKSYGYKQRITIDELNAGVPIYTQGPNAVIRLTPIQDKNLPSFQIQTPHHGLMSLKDASNLFTQDDPIEKSIFGKRHILLQLKSELGAGPFILSTQSPAHMHSNAYILSVLDKFSTTYLQVETHAIHYQFGDTVKAYISLINDSSEYSVDKISANIISPQSDIIPLTLKKVKTNTFEGTYEMNSTLNDKGENWYLEVKTESDFGHETLIRTGHTAFSYAIPSASLINIKKIASNPLTFVTTLDVATGSRYALQSVLFKKNAEGKAIPIQTSQKAQWFDPGKHVLQFTFDNTYHLSDDNLFLGYLRLVDYGQLKTVYQHDQPIKLKQLTR